MSKTKEYKNVLSKRLGLETHLEDILIKRVPDFYDRIGITIEAELHTFSENDECVSIIKDISQLRLLEGKLLNQITEEDND